MGSRLAKGMEMFRWNPMLESGIRVIDEQHRAIFEHAELLRNRTVAKCDRVQAALIFLGGYAVSHFDTEEMYMSRYEYPNLQAHKVQHDGFITTFAALKREYEESREEFLILMKITKAVLQLLEMHIKYDDMEFNRFLKARALVRPEETRKFMALQR